MDPQTVDGKYAGDREVFSGWKTIAHYLGKGVRTVQRYEHELRLPVRRPAHRNRGTCVFATKSELDLWVLSASMRSGPGTPKARRDVAEHEVEQLHQAAVQMKTLRNEARQLKRELAELRKDVSHQLRLVRTVLSSNKAKKSNDIKTRGVLLTCSYCRKTEASPETWIELENYVRRHNHAGFNHTVCPESRIWNAS